MKGQLTCEFKFATFSCRVRRQYQQDNEERDYSCQLQDALEPAVRMVSLSQYHAYTLLIILLNTVGINGTFVIVFDFVFLLTLG